MVYFQFLLVQMNNIVCIKTHALGKTDEEKEQINHFDPRVLEVVNLESPAFLGLCTPMFPECAISKLLQLVGGGGDVVIQPPTRGERIEFVFQFGSVHADPAVEFRLQVKQFSQHW